MADRTVVVQILVDSNDAQRGIDSTAAKSEGMGQAFKNAGALAVTWLAGKALNAVREFVDDSIRAYSDLEQAVGGTEAVFGDLSGVIEKHARGAADSMGMSEAAFRTATTLMGGQLKRMTGDVDFAAKHSVELVRIGADVAATYGGDVTEAVDALSAAFRGEADRAERFNFDLKVSRVNAKALEMGLADSTKTIDDQARAQALLALITEQSADAQGQFAREADTVAGKTARANAALENQKAILGEAISPWSTLKNDIWAGLGRTMADFATEFRQLTGQISDGQAAVTDYQVATGQYVDTAERAADAARMSGTSIGEVVAAAKLGTEELFKLRDADAAWLESMGLSKDQAEELASAVDQKLNTAYAEMEDTRLPRYIKGQEDAADATEEATEAIESQADTIRALSDPMFAAIRQAEKLKEAQEAYTEAVKKHGPESQEALAAAIAIAEANIDLVGSFEKLQAEGIDPTGEAARRMFVNMGLTHPQIDAIFRQFDQIERNLESRNLKLTIGVPTMVATASGSQIGWKRGPVVSFAKGGVAQPTPGGIDAKVADAGKPEAIAPVDTLMDMIRQAVDAGVPRPSIILQVNAARSQPLDGWAIIEALQRVQQTSGPLPIEVRS